MGQQRRCLPNARSQVRNFVSSLLLTGLLFPGTFRTFHKVPVRFGTSVKVRYAVQHLRRSLPELHCLLSRSPLPTYHQYLTSVNPIIFRSSPPSCLGATQPYQAGHQRVLIYSKASPCTLTGFQQKGSTRMHPLSV